MKSYNDQDYKEALEESKEICRKLKKVLKLRSKSQLIDIVISYGSDLREMQAALKQLHEENKSLKGDSTPCLII